MHPSASRTTDRVPDPPATAAELEALDALGKEGIWSVGGFEQKLTNLDKVLFPPAPDRPDDPPITKRELIRYLRPDRARRSCRTWPTGPLNIQRFPDGVGGPSFWQKQLPATAPAWLTRWRETGVEDHRAPNIHLVADRVATLAFLGNQAAFEFHAWTSRIDAPWQPDVRPHRHRPGRADDLGRDARPGAALPDRTRPPRGQGLPEDHRQARHPGLDPDRAAVHVPGDERLGRAAQPGGRGDRPRPRQLGVVEGRAGWPGPPRLHPERLDQDARRARMRSGPPPARPSRRRSPGTSSTTPPSDRTAGRSATSSTRVEARGDLFAAALTEQQTLPTLG